MSREVAAEDLLVLARQCKLDERDERRFEVALQSSRELECLFEAGLHFDREAALSSGDEARFRRLVERTLERAEQNERMVAARLRDPVVVKGLRKSRAASVARYFAASLACGVLLCVTLASAWDYLEARALRRAEQGRELRANAAAHPTSRRLAPRGSAAP